ncbi:MAG: major facilitator superfamily domain-containing protein 6 [Gemmatimonadota bacterium]
MSAGPRSPVRAERLAKSFYFLYYGAMACLFPFLALHYQSLGLSGRQIGLLAGIPPALILVGASLWGALADATRRHRQILFLAILGTLGFVAALSAVRAFYLLIPVVVVLALCQAPIVPLVDNSVMEMLGDRKERYGRLRLWGAVGWGAAGPLAGRAVEVYGLSWSFYLYLALLSGCLVVARFLPIGHVHISGAFWAGLRRLVGDRQWITFLFLAFASGAGLAVVHHFLFLYLETIGASRSLMGFALTVGTASEMAVFFYSDRLLRRFDRRQLLVFSLLAGAVRVTAYSFTHSPALAVAFQLLHGPSFALLWVAGVAYASALAPPGLGATAQGQFLGVNFGLGGAAGALAGGALYQSFGFFVMYRAAGLWLVAAALLFLLASRPSRAAAPA